MLLVKVDSHPPLQAFAFFFPPSTQRRRQNIFLFSSPSSFISLPHEKRRSPLSTEIGAFRYGKNDEALGFPTFIYLCLIDKRKIFPFHSFLSNGNLNPFCRRISSIIRMTAIVCCPVMRSLCKRPASAHACASRISYSKPLISKGWASSTGSCPSKCNTACVGFLNYGISIWPFVPYTAAKVGIFTPMAVVSWAIVLPLRRVIASSASVPALFITSSLRTSSNA